MKTLSKKLELFKQVREFDTNKPHNEFMKLVDNIYEICAIHEIPKDILNKIETARRFANLAKMV